MGSTPLPHIAIFPFMAKGHTIPLLHLAHLLHRRRLATLTFFTTHLNASFLRRSLAGTDASVVELPFPHDPPGLPPGVESTDRLPSMSLFLPFIRALDRLRPHFEAALRRMPAVSFLISDSFLCWTKDSAAKLGIPRVAFSGMGNFATTVVTFVRRYRPQLDARTSEHQSFTVPGLPNVRLTGDDLWMPSDDPDIRQQTLEFFNGVMEATADSHGLIMNSFYELEPVYFDFWNKRFRPKSWCIGPVCLADQSSPPAVRPAWMQWLDARSAVGRPVLYVAFGTQAEVSGAQLREIAAGLERSGLDFLWVVRALGAELGEGFEERVAERGRVVRGWVEQPEVLRHDGVKGFVSHCGWNSVMEGLCAGVPILAWPMMAEQHLNAKLVVEVLRVGVRVPTSGGLVSADVVERMARELMVGESGRVAAEKAEELGGAARRAMDVGGSSWRSLELMIDEVCGMRAALPNGHKST